MANRYVLTCRVDMKIMPLILTVLMTASPLHAEGFFAKLRAGLTGNSPATKTLKKPDLPDGTKPLLWKILLRDRSEVVDIQCDLDTSAEALHCKHGIWAVANYLTVQNIHYKDEPDYSNAYKEYLSMW